MILNFTDPFFTTRVLGFEHYLIDYRDFQSLLIDRQATRRITLEKMVIILPLKLL